MRFNSLTVVAASTLFAVNMTWADVLTIYKLTIDEDEVCGLHVKNHIEALVTQPSVSSGNEYKLSKVGRVDIPSNGADFSIAVDSEGVAYRMVANQTKTSDGIKTLEYTFDLSDAANEVNISSGSLIGFKEGYLSPLLLSCSKGKNGTTNPYLYYAGWEGSLK
jgi:hypothetical protein